MSTSKLPEANREKNSTNNKLVLEYNAFKYLGFGIGLEHFNIYIKAKGEDYPNIDFNGTFEFSYFGLMAYCKEQYPCTGNV